MPPLVMDGRRCEGKKTPQRALAPVRTFGHMNLKFNLRSSLDSFEFPTASCIGLVQWIASFGCGRVPLSAVPVAGRSRCHNTCHARGVAVLRGVVRFSPDTKAYRTRYCEVATGAGLRACSAGAWTYASCMVLHMAWVVTAATALKGTRPQPKLATHCTKPIHEAVGNGPDAKAPRVRLRRYPSCSHENLFLGKPISDRPLYRFGAMGR